MKVIVIPNKSSGSIQCFLLVVYEAL